MPFVSLKFCPYNVRSLTTIGMPGVLDCPPAFSNVAVLLTSTGPSKIPGYEGVQRPCGATVELPLNCPAMYTLTCAVCEELGLPTLIQVCMIEKSYHGNQ